MHLRSAAITLSTLIGLGLLSGCSGGADDGLPGGADMPVAEQDAFAAKTRAWGIGNNEYEPVRLIMPHRSIELRGVEITPTLDDFDADELDLAETELQAAEGYEFVHVGVQDVAAPYADPEADTTVALTIDGEEHDVTEAMTSTPGQPAMGDTLHVVASVPVDASVILSLTSEGETAEVDVRTRELLPGTSDGPMAAYGLDWVHELSGEMESTGVIGYADPTLAAGTGGVHDVNITLGFDSATVSSHAWANSVGWAPDGETYLMINGVNLFSMMNSGGCVGSWGTKDAMTFTPDGGEPIAALAFAVDSKTLDPDVGLVFTIPTDTESGVLTFAPVGSTHDGCTFHEQMAPAELDIQLAS